MSRRPPRTVTWCPITASANDHAAIYCLPYHVTFDLVPRGGAAVVRAVLRHDKVMSNENLRRIGVAITRMRAKGRKR